MRLSRSEAERLRNVADRYAREAGLTEIEVMEAVAWGVRQGELGLSEEEVHEVLVHRMSEALRCHNLKLPDGTRVRLRHCVEIMANGNGRALKQRTFWSHVDDARDEFLVESLRQRRGRIGADVTQLRADLEYINERREARGLRPIQMTFNFDDPDEGEVGVA